MKDLYMGNMGTFKIIPKTLPEWIEGLPDGSQIMVIKDDDRSNGLTMLTCTDVNEVYVLSESDK